MHNDSFLQSGPGLVTMLPTIGQLIGVKLVGGGSR